jgi:hypothetical protein
MTQDNPALIARLAQSDRPLTHVLTWIVPLACVALGTLSLISIVGPGDGTWILYARQMADGKRLYSDLGLNQQPIFPLLSLFAAKLSSGGILGDKAVFFGLLLTHVLLVHANARRIADGPWRCATLTAAIFVTAIHFEAFRYDDYHALAQSAVLASFYCSLRFIDGDLGARHFAMLQGGLTALAFLTRVNEGAAIGGAAALIMLSSGVPLPRKGRMLAVSACSGILVFALTMLVIGETPLVWFNQTLVQASGAKGGGSLLSHPGMAVMNAFAFMVPSNFGRRAIALFALALLASTFLLLRRTREGRLPIYIPVLVGALGFGILSLGYVSDPLVTLTALALLMSVAAVLLLASGMVKQWQLDRRPLATVLRMAGYPLLLFCMASLSTGGEIRGLSFPLAISLLTGALALARPRERARSAASTIFYTILLLTGVSGLSFRWNDPFSWLDYRVPPLLTDYVTVNDARHGPHLLPRETRDLVVPVCRIVEPGQSMLSLPYSFANYYCRIPLWQGQVQSFFDTSTAVQVDQIAGGLTQSPPQYIFYQRQPHTLALHEKLFNQGRPLAHRRLDRIIIDKVASGRWKVVYRSQAFAPSRWYLIRTS